MEYQIGAMEAEDWTRVRTIYGQGLATGIAAFITTPPSCEDWDAEHLQVCRIVAREDSGGVLGWSALAPVADN